MPTCWPWRSKLPCCREGCVTRNWGWALGSESSAQLTASKKEGTSVLQLQGIEFCQQPVSSEEDPFPGFLFWPIDLSEEIRIPADTLISALWDSEQKTQLKRARLLLHISCELVNYNGLGHPVGGNLVHSSRKLIQWVTEGSLDHVCEFLATPHGMCDLSSPTRDGTHAPCIRSAES